MCMDQDLGEERGRVGEGGRGVGHVKGGVLSDSGVWGIFAPVRMQSECQLRVSIYIYSHRKLFQKP